MWRWDWELRSLGFRRLSDHYWQCSGRFGLAEPAYLSLFADGPRRWRRPGQARDRPLEVAAFHVTFPAGVDHLHFYYHEHDTGAWVPGGHTTSGELTRYPVDPLALRQEADGVARALVEAWGAVLLPRRGEARGDP